MLSFNNGLAGRPLAPEELSHLKTVFEQHCRNVQIACDSVQASAAASLLIAAYQHGITEKTELLRRLDNSQRSGTG